MSASQTDINAIFDRATRRLALLLTAEMSAFVAIVYLMVAIKG